MREKRSRANWTSLLVCLALAGAIWLVYGQTLGYSFVNYDDPTYVYENPIVTQGLSLPGITWAFTHSHGTNWHPLTSLSHMLDCQLFGLNAGGHHFTSVLLHMIASLLLFFILKQLTSSLWRSAFVAAVFALHPTHVESVAWIAERKDVLSAIFFVLTLGAYLRYVRHSSGWNYLLVTFVLVLGLMSKPMLVTLPFVLLLLDFWPLRRYDLHRPQLTSRPHKQRWQALPIPIQLLLEKVPWITLAIISSVVTCLVQQDAMKSIDRWPISLRLANAALSYVLYLREMVWPFGLVSFYALHTGSNLWLEVVLAVAFMVLVTLAVWHWRRRHPYLLTGWLWYLGMLLPVIGLVQVGSQARADRYTYLPQIGLYIIVAWAATDLAANWLLRRGILATAGCLVLISLSYLSWKQVSSWRDSEALWTHLLEVQPDSAKAHTNLGAALLKKGRVNEAIAEGEIAVAKLDSGSGKVTDGDNNNLKPAFRTKSDRAPELARYIALMNLANALAREDKVEEARQRYEEGTRLLSDHPQAYNGIGAIYLRQAKWDDAIRYFEKAGEVSPDSVVAKSNLAWILATRPDLEHRDGARAVQLAYQAELATAGKNVVVLHTLAAAFAQNGQFAQAMETLRRTLVIARKDEQAELARECARELELYQKGISYR